MEVKRAMLRTWEDGRAVLILVDENYEIHSPSGSAEALHMLLQDVELPNFEWVHVSGGRAYYAEGAEYKGRYHAGKWLTLLNQYNKGSKLATSCSTT